MRSRTCEYRSEFARGCTDIDQLTIWLRRAVTARSIDEVFV